MKNFIVETFDVLQTADDAVDNIVDVTEELDTAKLTIDMYPDNIFPTEKARIYRDRLLKLGAKKCILSAFCTFIVVPISLAFLEAGDVPPILSLLILAYMVKKRAPIILEDIGLF